MNVIRVALILLFFAIRSFASDTNNPALFKLADVLPNGQCEIELMTIRYTDRANELALKLQTAVATNRDWFMDYIKQAKPGEPLDYDPRLGLTKDEYTEYLRESENHHLATTGTSVPCVFHQVGNMLSLDVGDTNSPLSKIRLNTKSGELFASVGKVGTPTWESNDDSDKPIGCFDGCSWLYEKDGPGEFDIRIVKFNIWRLKPSGKILWRFEDSEMLKKQMKQNFQVLFQYSLQTTQQSSVGGGSWLPSGEKVGSK